MLEALPQQQHVRRTKAVILVTAERRISIDIGASERRLKIERHDVPSRGHGQRSQKSHSHSSFEISNRSFRALRMGDGVKHAIIWAVRQARLQDSGVGSIRRKLARESRA